MTAYFVLSLALVGSSACPGSGYLGPCPADMNGDGTVGVPEFLELLAAWGPNPCARADLDGDRDVDVADFLILIAAWDQTESPADLDGDGVVGAGDFLVMLVQWG